MKRLEGEIWCESCGAAHAPVGDPYGYGPDDDHPNAEYCKPEDWRKLWVGGTVEAPRACTAQIAEGEHGGVFKPTACGCKVTGEGNLRSPIAIAFCALHSAADDLAGACHSMIETTGGSEFWNGATHDSLVLIEAALSKADRR